MRTASYQPNESPLRYRLPGRRCSSMANLARDSVWRLTRRCRLGDLLPELHRPRLPKPSVSCNWPSPRALTVNAFHQRHAKMPIGIS